MGVDTCTLGIKQITDETYSIAQEALLSALWCLKERGHMCMRALPGGAVVKTLPAMQETQEAWV